MSSVTQRLFARERRSTLGAIVIVVVLLGFVIQESWAGRPITGDSILFFLVVGVTLGSIYAVAATGLVVTYTTSGIFNFAQGAMGMFCAFVYWELKVNAGIQTFVALVAHRARRRAAPRRAHRTHPHAPAVRRATGVAARGDDRPDAVPHRARGGIWDPNSSRGRSARSSAATGSTSGRRSCRGTA